MSIPRHDLKSNATQIPRETKQALVRLGGKNIYGEPMYRLLRAEDRIILAPGEWAIWPDHVSVDDRGGLGIDVLQKMLTYQRETMEHMVDRGASQHEIDKAAKRCNGAFEELLQSKLSSAPLRTERGMKEIQLYPYEGFILEKWKPVERFGSPDEWNRITFDGMPAAGPYPQYGDYELLAGPTPYMPTIAQLEDAIRQNFQDVQNRPGSAAERVRLLLERTEQAKQAKDKEQWAKADAFRKDNMMVMKTLSLPAGRVRQELATRAGKKGHYGN